MLENRQNEKLPQTATLKRYMDVGELAEHLGIPKWTLYQWVSQQRIPHYKFGGLLRFSNSEIEAWAQKHRREGQEPAQGSSSRKSYNGGAL